MLREVKVEKGRWRDGMDLNNWKGCESFVSTWKRLPEWRHRDIFSHTPNVNDEKKASANSRSFQFALWDLQSVSKSIESIVIDQVPLSFRGIVPSQQLLHENSFLRRQARPF